MLFLHNSRISDFLDQLKSFTIVDSHFLGPDREQVNNIIIRMQRDGREIGRTSFWCFVGQTITPKADYAIDGGHVVSREEVYLVVIIIGLQLKMINSQERVHSRSAGKDLGQSQYTI